VFGREIDDLGDVPEAGVDFGTRRHERPMIRAFSLPHFGHRGANLDDRAASDRISPALFSGNRYQAKP
jgi:hypothetical protein